MASNRSRLTKLTQWQRQIRTTGPLLSSAFFSLACFLVPAEGFGTGHALMFGFADPIYWGIASAIAPILGYYGLFKNKRVWWLRGHAIASFVLYTISFGYLLAYIEQGVGGPTAAGLAFGLALNSSLRAADKYKDPFY